MNQKGLINILAIIGLVILFGVATGKGKVIGEVIGGGVGVKLGVGTGVGGVTCLVEIK